MSLSGFHMSSISSQAVRSLSVDCAPEYKLRLIYHQLLPKMMQLLRKILKEWSPNLSRSMFSQTNATQHLGGSMQIVDSMTFIVSATIAMVEVSINPSALRYDIILISSNLHRLRESWDVALGSDNGWMEFFYACVYFASFQPHLTSFQWRYRKNVPLCIATAGTFDYRSDDIS